MTGEIELWVTERDGTKIAPLPEANLGDTAWDLNDVGSLEFKLDPQSEGAREIEGIVTEIQCWMDGSLEWWGIPWNFGGNSSEMTVGCEGLGSLFNKRFVDRMSLLYTSIDQFQIAWNLLAYAQSEAVEPYRDFNIQCVSPLVPSGVTRSRDYKREDHACIFDLLKEFNRDTLLNGFDWEIAFTEDGGRFFTPYYPMKGEPKEEFAIVWEPGSSRNIADFEWSEDFLPLTTLAYVTGGSVSTGSVSIKMEGKYEDEDYSAYWGQMQNVISEGTQLDTDWLDDRAEQEVNSNRDPAQTVSITSALEVDGIAIGDLVVGDWVPVKVDCGRIQVESWNRIGQVKRNQNDTVSLSFVEEVLVP